MGAKKLGVGREEKGGKGREVVESNKILKIDSALWVKRSVSFSQNGQLSLPSLCGW